MENNPRPHFYRAWDFWLLMGLLTVCSNPFVPGGPRFWALYPTLVEAGEFWRIFTYAFAHLTWYHFLLDCVPFLVLYCTLEESSVTCRLIFVLAGDIGSMFAALVLSPIVYQIGLYGMSGITYGIMAVSALETIYNHPDDRVRGWTGVGVFAALAVMVVFELATGKFPFERLLFGMVGTPILTCHAGGVTGCVLAFFGCRYLRRFVCERAPGGVK